jgi:predicted dienelactone hydrolase
VISCVGLAHAACPGQNLLENPADPGEPGPWPVSSVIINGTITKRNLPLEIWFPAKVGSEKDAGYYTYSPIDHLPDDQRSKIPTCPASNPHPTKPTCCEPTQFIDRAWMNLPMDTEHGPYPVIIFIHGTAAYRQYFMHIVEHWASRGFVVVGTDYPGEITILIILFSFTSLIFTAIQGSR